MTTRKELPRSNRSVSRYHESGSHQTGHDWRDGFIPEKQELVPGKTFIEHWEDLHWQVKSALYPSDIVCGEYIDSYANHFQAGTLFEKQLGFAKFGAGEATRWRLYALSEISCTLDTVLPPPPPLVRADWRGGVAVSERPPASDKWDGQFLKRFSGFIGHLPQGVVTELLQPFKRAKKRPTAEYSWRTADGYLTARVHVTNASDATWAWCSRPYLSGKDPFDNPEPWHVRAWTASVDLEASQALMAYRRASNEEQQRVRQQGRETQPPGTESAKPAEQGAIEGQPRRGRFRRMLGL